MSLCSFSVRNASNSSIPIIIDAIKICSSGRGTYDGISTVIRGFRAKIGWELSLDLARRVGEIVFVDESGCP